MRGRRWLVATGAVALALAVAAPDALARFGPPQTVSSFGAGAIGALDASGSLRALWHEPEPVRTTPLRFARATRRGRSGGQRTIGRFHGRPYTAEALPKGRTMVAQETDKGIVIAVLSRSGRRLHERSFRGSWTGVGEADVSATVGGAAVVVWTQRSGGRDRVVVAAVRPSGHTTVETVATSSGSTDDCCWLTAAGSHLAVMWLESTRDAPCGTSRTSVLKMSRLTADGRPAGDPVSVVPECSADREVASILGLSARPDGSVAAAWNMVIGGRSYRPEMREVGPAGALGPVVSLAAARSSRAHPPDARVHATPDGKVAAVVAGRTVTAVVIDRNGAVLRRSVLSRSGNGSFSFAGQGDHAVVAWQSVRGAKSSIYAAELTRGRFGRGQLVGRGTGRSRNNSAPFVAMNSRGRAVVMYDVQSDRYPFELGIRAAFN